MGGKPRLGAKRLLERELPHAETDRQRRRARTATQKQRIPRGGKRLLQRAEGYVCTIKTGVVTFEDGKWTGATPGGLIRGPQQVEMLEAAE